MTALDPVHVDFTLPQQTLPQLRVGLTVSVSVDAFPERAFAGQLAAIDPALDASTRSVQLRATLENREGKLRPGMFAHVQVLQPEARRVLILPATAVIYAPYGDSVFVIDEERGSGKVARQAFVRLGERRGDYVEVIKGVSQGETVVATGAFKLRNGMSVMIDNELLPKLSQSPRPSNN